MVYSEEKYKVSDKFMCREVAGMYVLISLEGNIDEFNGYMQVNEPAYFLWQHMHREITKKELAKAMIDEYSIDEETAIYDIEEFLKLLIKYNIVEAY